MEELVFLIQVFYGSTTDGAERRRWSVEDWPEGGLRSGALWVTESTTNQSHDTEFTEKDEVDLGTL